MMSKKYQLEIRGQNLPQNSSYSQEAGFERKRGGKTIQDNRRGKEGVVPSAPKGIERGERAPIS